ncbi:hypothetical protein ACTFRD_31820 [Bacillus cereus group sp. MYBK249-1]|uniref:hypothetical protein n=1 Tax=unclassified Bacillus cereus group TaxID=2750818 RepID=UPI003F7AD445
MLKELEEKIKVIEVLMFCFSLYALLPYVYDYFVLNFKIPQILTGDPGRIFVIGYEAFILISLFCMTVFNFKLNKKRRKLIG